jgi:hypothetical protein
MMRRQEGHPGLYSSLAGKMETAAGDALFESDERYYLLELKGGPSQISTEWRPPKDVINPDAAGVGEPKVLHKWAMSLAFAWSGMRPVSRRATHIDGERPAFLAQAKQGPFPGKSSAERLDDVLQLCLRGHHLCWWDTKAVRETDELSGLLIEPYVLATLRRLAAGKSLSKIISSAHARLIRADILDRWALSRSTIDDVGIPTSALAKALPLSTLYKRTGFVINEITHAEHALGLSWAELQDYIGAITSSKGEALEMNAVVLGDRGFYRWIGRFSELAPALNPSVALQSIGSSKHR